VTCLQVREKGSAQELYETARRALTLTRPRGIPLIVNDRLDVAMAVDADGVHLGQSDLDTAAARRLWGSNKQIGVSVSSLVQLQKAEKDGADYLGIGALFPTQTKTDADSISLNLLTELISFTSLPVVGIGGINLNNARQVFECGCQGVAVVSAVWADPDAVSTVANLRQIAQRYRP